jgi:hypothetical protein
LCRIKFYFLPDEFFHEWTTLKSTRGRFPWGCLPNDAQCNPHITSSRNFLFQYLCMKRCSFSRAISWYKNIFGR